MPLHHIKAPHYRPFVRGIHRWWWFSLTQRVSNVKFWSYICHQPELVQTIELPMIWDIMTHMWPHSVSSRDTPHYITMQWHPVPFSEAMMPQALCHYSQSNKMSYCKISQILEVARLVAKIIISLWNLPGYISEWSRDSIPMSHIFKILADLMARCLLTA